MTRDNIVRNNWVLLIFLRDMKGSERIDGTIKEFANAEVSLPTGVNLSKNPDNTGDSPVLLSSCDSLAYLSNITSQRSEYDQQWWRLLKKKIKELVMPIKVTAQLDRGSAIYLAGEAVRCKVKVVINLKSILGVKVVIKSILRIGKSWNLKFIFEILIVFY